MPAWSLDRARHTYSIPYWSDGYFDVDDLGRMCALPRGAGGPMLALPEILEQATATGLKLPLLLRFSDILGDRLRKLQAAFKKAMDDPEHQKVMDQLNQDTWYRTGDEYRAWAIATFAKDKALIERLGLAAK